MKLDLNAIKPVRKFQPPRVILYGTPKIGKSTFCSHIANAIFFDVEGGTDDLTVARIPKEQLESYEDVVAALNAMLSQDHPFETLVLDTADFLEKVLQRQAAAEHGVSEFGKIGYGKGPVTLANLWRQITQILDDLRSKRGIAIVLIAHETLKRVNDPNTDTYDKFTLAMENKSIEFLESWADIIMFAKEEVYTEKKAGAIGGKVNARKGDRILYTRDSPSFLAGNRYGLPDTIPFTWEAFSAAFAKVMAQPVVEEEQPEQPELPINQPTEKGE